MLFEIDISGQDILSSNYAIAVTNKDSLIYGYRFDKSIIYSLNQNYSKDEYKYKQKKGKKKFKIRIYCIVIHHIFKKMLEDNHKQFNKEISLNICRDFDGHENDIKSNLEFLLGTILRLSVSNFKFCKLSTDSYAHKYAYIFRKDIKNIYPNLISISLKEFEKFLRKRVPKDTNL